MPRKLSTNAVKQMFIDAGYELDPNFNYKNSKTKIRVYDHLKDKYVKISVQNLKYHVKKGNRPSWTDLPLPPVQDDSNVSLNQLSNNRTLLIIQPRMQQSPIERFVNHHDDLKDVKQPLQQVAYQTYVMLMPQLNRMNQFT